MAGYRPDNVYSAYRERLGLQVRALKCESVVDLLCRFMTVHIIMSMISRVYNPPPLPPQNPSLAQAYASAVGRPVIHSLIPNFLNRPPIDNKITNSILYKYTD